ncbi:hypothetical protein FQN57_003770 [Myotisia sp. PD_48]|nr:hypothetical protein FQN57_003770 [Myotisia sp. PD_48]
MAANDYYNGFPPQQPASRPLDQHLHDHNNAAWAQHSPSPGPASPSPYSDPYNRYSQQTMDSHNDLAAGGRIPASHSHDQYEDNIPLKQNSAQQGKHDWMDADTHYAPAHDPNAMPLNNEPESRPHRRRSSRRRKKGFFAKKIAFVTYTLSFVQIIVFIVELVRNAQLTGSPIMTKPSFNPMIGPSPYVQINMGARFVACMRNVEGIQTRNQTLLFPCPNSTTREEKCTLSELCGFNGVPNPRGDGDINGKPEPNQWFRFIVPIFLHAGLIHIAFNLFAQMTVGADMERTIGWWRYAIVYFSSGIFGFVLGGNFAAPATASTGASGSLFGIFALCMLDLFYTWDKVHRPVMQLATMVITILITFALGLLPGLDNFSHIGGFLTGLVLGICLLRSPNKLRERIGTHTPYMSMSGHLGAEESPKKYIKEPLSFFQGRKPLWWGWWLVRVGALVGILVSFIVLLNNFYKYRSTCSWCKYLSCLPVRDWCNIGQFITEEKSPNKARALFL